MEISEINGGEKDLQIFINEGSFFSSDPEDNFLELRTHFGMILKNISVALYCINLNKNNHVCFFSKRLAEWTGYTTSELLRIPFLWINCIESVDKLMYRKRYVIPEYPYENEVSEYVITHSITKERRSIREQRANMIKEKDGSYLLYYLLYDITHQKKIEKKLENCSKLLRQYEEVFYEIDKTHLPTVTETAIPFSYKPLKPNVNPGDFAGPNTPDWVNLLTPRELRICELIKKGKTSDEISLELGITTRTVRFHRGNIRKKIGIANTKVPLTSFLRSMKF